MGVLAYETHREVEQYVDTCTKENIRAAKLPHKCNQWEVASDGRNERSQARCILQLCLKHSQSRILLSAGFPAHMCPCCGQGQPHTTCLPLCPGSILHIPEQKAAGYVSQLPETCWDAAGSWRTIPSSSAGAQPALQHISPMEYARPLSAPMCILAPSRAPIITPSLTVWRSSSHFR